jgi:hypothetical protein
MMAYRRKREYAAGYKAINLKDAEWFGTRGIDYGLIIQSFLAYGSETPERNRDQCFDQTIRMTYQESG